MSIEYTPIGELSQLKGDQEKVAYEETSGIQYEMFQQWRDVQGEGKGFTDRDGVEPVVTVGTWNHLVPHYLSSDQWEIKVLIHQVCNKLCGRVDEVDVFVWGGKGCQEVPGKEAMVISI